MAATNGRVVKILSAGGGMAQPDTDGDGAADTGTGLVPALSDAERRDSQRLRRLRLQLGPHCVLRTLHLEDYKELRQIQP